MLVVAPGNVLDWDAIDGLSETLGKNEKIGPRGRWWLEEHAKYDDEHPIHALEIIKSCVAKGEDPDDVASASTKSSASGTSASSPSAPNSAACASGLIHIS